MTMASSAGGTRVSSDARCAIFSSRPLVSATPRETATSSANRMRRSYLRSLPGCQGLGAGGWGWGWLLVAGASLRRSSHKITRAKAGLRAALRRGFPPERIQPTAHPRPLRLFLHETRTVAAIHFGGHLLVVLDRVSDDFRLTANQPLAAAIPLRKTAAELVDGRIGIGADDLCVLAHVRPREDSSRPPREIVAL